MAENKQKVYFGCLPKEQVFQFIEGFKAALAEGKQGEEKKKFDFEIRGMKEEPKGISFETYSVTKDNYANFVDSSKDYMGKALTVFSVSLNAKDEESVKTLEALFEKMKPMFSILPFVKAHPEKYEIHFRTNGKKVAIDFTSVTGEFLKPLLDIGLNLSDYHHFYLAFKSNFCPDDFFKLPIEELSLKVVQILLSAKGESKGIRHILTALIKSLKNIKLSNEKFQKKLDDNIGKLSMLNSFVSFVMNFEYDGKELCGTGLEASKQFLTGIDINQKLTELRGTIENMGKNMLKPLLEQYQLIDSVKATDVDEISISFTIPKYQNGIAHVIKLPGFSKAFAEKVLS